MIIWNLEIWSGSFYKVKHIPIPWLRNSPCRHLSRRSENTYPLKELFNNVHRSVIHNSQKLDQMFINRRGEKYIWYIHQWNTTQQENILMCCPEAPSGIKDLFPYLLGALLEDSLQQSALFLWGANFLGWNTQPCPKHHLLPGEAVSIQCLMNTGLGRMCLRSLEITLTGHLAPELLLAGRNHPYTHGSHCWKLPWGIHWGWCRDCFTASLLFAQFCFFPLLSKAVDPKRPP